MPDPIPFVFNHPKLTLKPTGGASAAFDLQCYANEIGDEVDQDSDDWQTFCATGTTYGPPQRKITGTFYVSYGADGLWHKLHALEGQTVDFALLPDGNAAVSADNPEMTGTVRIPAIPFIGGPVGPGKASTVDLELSVSSPVWAEAPASQS